MVYALDQPSSSSASTSHVSMAFDYEHQLPKPMCGTAALRKLGIMSSQRKCRPQRNNQKKVKKYREMPLELTPINTLFVTEEEFLRGLHGTTLSESGSSDHERTTPTPVAMPSNHVPQFDVMAAVAYGDEGTHMQKQPPSTPERSRSVTPKSGNKHYTFTTYDDVDGGEEKVDDVDDDEDYVGFKDAPHHTQQTPPPSYQEEAHVYHVRESTVEDAGKLPTPSKDDSTISTTEDLSESSQNISHHQDGTDENDGHVLITMRDTILKQQDNLKQLAVKNAQYRNRLAASHERVLALRQDHIGSIDAIIKLQFERESFEAEAVWLREELKTIRKELTALNQKDIESRLRREDDDMKRKLTTQEASSEVRWTRAQRFLHKLKVETNPDEQQPVEEPPSPFSYASPSQTSTGIDETPQRNLSNVSPDERSESKSSPRVAAATILRVPRHSTSFSSQASSTEDTNDAKITTPPSTPKKSVRFHPSAEDHMDETASEKQTRLPISPRKNAKVKRNQLDLEPSQTPEQGFESGNEELEVPTRQSPTCRAPCSVPQRDSLSSALVKVSPKKENEHFTLKLGCDEEKPQENITPSDELFENHLETNKNYHERSAPNVQIQSRAHQVRPWEIGTDRQSSKDASKSSNPSNRHSYIPPHSNKTQPTTCTDEAAKTKQVTTDAPLDAISKSEDQSIDASNPKSTLGKESSSYKEIMDVQSLKDRIESLNRVSNHSAHFVLKDSARRSSESPKTLTKKAATKPVSPVIRAPNPSPKHAPIVSGLHFQNRASSRAAKPSSPIQKSNEVKEAQEIVEEVELSPRSRYLAAVTRPFPENSTLMLSKVRYDRETQTKPTKLQPRSWKKSDHQFDTTSKPMQSELLETQQKVLIPTPLDKKPTVVSFDPFRNQNKNIQVRTSDNGNNVVEGNKLSVGTSNTTTTENYQDSNTAPGFNKIKSESQQSDHHETKPSRSLASFRQQHHAQSLGQIGISPRKPKLEVSIDPLPLSSNLTSPTCPAPVSPKSPSSPSALRLKATRRVRNREGRDGSSPLSSPSSASTKTAPAKVSSSSPLSPSLPSSSPSSSHTFPSTSSPSVQEMKRHYMKMKKQASAPTMSFAEANAELRWVKSQQHILEQMKTNVEKSSLVKRRATTGTWSGGNSGASVSSKSVESEALVDPNSMEELNRRVNKVRMQLIKATVDAFDFQEESRDDDIGIMDRDYDLPIHYGRC